MKYFIHLAYKGTNYHGWQRQPGFVTVQETLEEALRQMLGEKVNCIGCGRTDAGVHASQYFCHIVVDQAFGFDPVFRLNKMLPGDISVFDVTEVDRNVHAQHDAIERTYTYRVHTAKNAFLSELSAFYTGENLEVARMKTAAELAAAHRDFRFLCKQPGLYKSTICEIAAAGWTEEGQGSRISFRISADRFLKGMVRILVGNMLETGYGRLSLDEFQDCLHGRRKVTIAHMAYPQGLYLSGVKYPFLDLKNKNRL